MLPFELQLGGLLDGDDPLMGWNCRRQRVEEGGLSRAGPARDDDVPPTRDSVGEERRTDPTRRERLERDPAAREPPDRDARSVDGERWKGHVEPRTIGQTGVDDGRCPIETQAQRRDDTLDQPADRIGVEIEWDGLDVPVALDVRTPGTVDHHLGDIRVGEVGFERTEARDLGDELVDESTTARRAQQGRGLVEQGREPLPDQHLRDRSVGSVVIRARPRAVGGGPRP